MFSAVLILASIFNNIQARFANETQHFLHDVHKRSPVMWPAEFMNSKMNIDGSNTMQRQSSRSQRGSSNLCAGMPVDRCAYKHPQEVKQCKVCGLINLPGINNMVIEGIPVIPPYKYPWTVALMRDNDKKCGAAIISDRYVLTAAHCVAKRPEDLPSGFKSTPGKEVYFGPNEMSLGFVSRTTRVKRGPPIEKVIPHPKFNRLTMRYDVALLKLKERITCSKYRNPICLPSPDMRINMDDVLHFTGWGTIKRTEPHEFPKGLVEATARLVNFSQCKSRVNYTLGDISYCLVGRNRSTPCYGDSGGAMFYSRKRKIYAMGVASIHTCKKCGLGKPFVYVAIPKILRWIERIAGPRIKP